MLTNIICELVNNDIDYNGEKFVAGKLCMSFGDSHIYEDHLNVVNEQISRIPFEFPKLKINKKLTCLEDLNSFKFEDIEIIGYKSHSALKAKMIA